MPATRTITEDQPAVPRSQEEAQEQDFHMGHVVTISAGHAVHDTYTAFLPSLLPVFIANLSLSNAQAGLLTVFLQGPSLLQPFIGYLADRANLRTIFVLAPAVTSVMMSLLGLSPAYGFLALLLVVAGISSASIHAVGPVIAGHLSGRKLGRGMGIWMVGGELGRTLGPLVIVSAIQFLTLRGTPWLMIAGLLTSAFLHVRLRDVSGRPPTIGQSRPWRQAIRRMGPLLVPLTGIIVARSFMSSALTTYLPTFLHAEGAALWYAGAALSILEGAGVVGALLGGGLSDRWGRRLVLFISLLTTPLLMLVFLAVDSWLQLLLLLMLGFTSLSITPVIMAMVQESFPENRALANGLYMALSFIIRSVIVVLVGGLGDWLGLRWAFTACAVVTLLGLPLLPLLPEKRAGS